VEALRYSKYVSEKTTIVLNTRKIVPLSVSIGNAEYPSIAKITEILEGIGCKVHSFDATAIAENVAKPQATNVVMIGALSKVVKLPFTFEYLENAVKLVLPEKLHKMNVKALKAGFEAF
jgi:indolepyruvate ferredoxin oxidoreductase beta subunit